MANYFNTLSLREQLEQLGQCEFMDRSEFDGGVEALKGKKIVIIGCGAQGLNQGLNMKDSGLDISYTLRPAAIAEKRQSYINATENGFAVGTYEEMIPAADLLINLKIDMKFHRIKRLLKTTKKASRKRTPHCMGTLARTGKSRWIPQNGCLKRLPNHYLKALFGVF